MPLWVSPEYPGVKPRAEFHPDAGWLRDHGRDPAMAKSVEFTNVRIFEAETRRMPNFALHELAHAYHDRVLAKGFANPEVKAAYERAKASGKYDRVERRHGNGQPNTFERAYAMTNPMEFFAEASEAFFSRNDFFPFMRDELKQHDPEMFACRRNSGAWNRRSNHETHHAHLCRPRVGFAGCGGRAGRRWLRPGTSARRGRSRRSPIAPSRASPAWPWLRAGGSGPTGMRA